MGCVRWKQVFGHMRTAKVKISLRIRAVWSGPSMSTNSIIGYYMIFQWRANAMVKLCTWAGSCKSAHFAYVQRHFIPWRGHILTVLFEDAVHHSAKWITAGGVGGDILAASSEKVPSSMRKMRRFRSSCACTKYYPGHCSTSIRYVESNDSVSAQWMRYRMVRPQCFTVRWDGRDGIIFTHTQENNA